MAGDEESLVVVEVVGQIIRPICPLHVWSIPKATPQVQLACLPRRRHLHELGESSWLSTIFMTETVHH